MALLVRQNQTSLGNSSQWGIHKYHPYLTKPALKSSIFYLIPKKYWFYLGCHIKHLSSDSLNGQTRASYIPAKLPYMPRKGDIKPVKRVHFIETGQSSQFRIKFLWSQPPYPKSNQFYKTSKNSHFEPRWHTPSFYKANPPPRTPSFRFLLAFLVLKRCTVEKFTNISFS